MAVTETGTPTAAAARVSKAGRPATRATNAMTKVDAFTVGRTPSPPFAKALAQRRVVSPSWSG